MGAVDEVGDAEVPLPGVGEVGAEPEGGQAGVGLVEDDPEDPEEEPDQDGEDVVVELPEVPLPPRAEAVVVPGGPLRGL